MKGGGRRSPKRLFFLFLLLARSVGLLGFAFLWSVAKAVLES